MSQETLVGIPGSVSPEAKRIRWRRFPGPESRGQRAYEADVPDGRLIAIVSRDPAGKDGKLLWHLSVSFRGLLVCADGEPNFSRMPSWDELKVAKYQLLQVDVPMSLIFPRKSADYVNLHPTTLHLWECEKGVDL